MSCFRNTARPLVTTGANITLHISRNKMNNYQCKLSGLTRFPKRKGKFCMRHHICHAVCLIGVSDFRVRMTLGLFFCVWIPIVVAGYSFIQLFQAQQFFFKNVVLRKSLTSKGPTPSSTSCIISTPTFSVKLNYYSKAFKHKSSFIPVMVTSFNTTCCWSLCLSRFSRSSSLNVLCEVVLLTRQIWQNLFAAKLSADPHSAWQDRLSAVKRQTVPCTVSVFVLLS